MRPIQRPVETWRALGLSLGIHVLCAVLMVAGLLWTREEAPLSVAGSVVEATLMSAPANYTPPPAQDRAPEPAPSAPKVQPKPTPAPQKAESELQPQPQAPQPKPDTRDTEKAAALALQQAEEKARKEEQERKRQEQILLEEQKQEEVERKERLRQQQLEREKQLAEVRKLREDAERKRRLEQEKLRQIEDQRREASDAVPQREAPPAQQLGNQGTDNSLLGRYQLAIQQAVQQNWLRPESARPGIRCSVVIVQIPGGEVIQASVSAPCNADDLTRRSLEAAVLKAQPLPYNGFESVFQREIRFNFRYDGE